MTFIHFTAFSQWEALEGGAQHLMARDESCERGAQAVWLQPAFEAQGALRARGETAALLLQPECFLLRR